jgi:hypothetical protein
MRRVVAFHPSARGEESSNAFPVIGDALAGNSMTDKRGILAGGQNEPR